MTHLDWYDWAEIGLIFVTLVVLLIATVRLGAGESEIERMARSGRPKR